MKNQTKIRMFYDFFLIFIPELNEILDENTNVNSKYHANSILRTVPMIALNCT